MRYKHIAVELYEVLRGIERDLYKDCNKRDSRKIRKFRDSIREKTQKRKVFLERADIGMSEPHTEYVVKYKKV